MAPSSQLHALLLRQGFSSTLGPSDGRSSHTELHRSSYRQQTTAISLLRRSGASRRKRSQFRPFESIPLEVAERILSFLPLVDLIRLKRLDRSFNSLLSHPHLYPMVHLLNWPPPPTPLLGLLPSLLPGTASLSLRSFALPILDALLPHVTCRLTILDLSFSAVGDEQLAVLAANGALGRVREIRLKGCRGVQDGEWLAGVLPSAKVVDLSWSGLATLPSRCGLAGWDEEDLTSQLSISPTSSDDSGFFESSPAVCPSPPSFPALASLSLSSLPYLPNAALAGFLASLPPTLITLDLSHLALTSSLLRQLVVPPSLRTLKLTGNDRLTLGSIEGMRRVWGKDVEVSHSAVLESEEVEDVRRFVEMVAGLVGGRN